MFLKNPERSKLMDDTKPSLNVIGASLKSIPYFDCKIVKFYLAFQKVT